MTVSHQRTGRRSRLSWWIWGSFHHSAKKFGFWEEVTHRLGIRWGKLTWLFASAERRREREAGADRLLDEAEAIMRRGGSTL